MHSDHFHPGCNVRRATVAPPRWTTFTPVFSGVRDSSGRSMLFVSMLGMTAAPLVSDGSPRRAGLHQELYGFAGTVLAAHHPVNG
jgi:hypothetical protein